MKQLKLLLIFLIYILYSIQINGVDLKGFRNYNNLDGFVTKPVNSIEQDTLGFMWFGTNNGLYRFDGEEFKAFLYDKENELSLSNNHINDLFVDKNNNLWIGTHGGLNKYNPHKDFFKYYFFNPRDSHSLRSDVILSINKYKDGCLWIGTEKGLSIFNPNNERFRNCLYHSENLIKLENKTIHSVFFDNHYRIWIGTWSSGLIMGKEKEGEFIFERVYDKAPVFDIKEDKNGLIWFAAYDEGLIRLDPDKLKYETLLPDKESVNRIPNLIKTVFFEDSNRIWFGGDKTFLNIYDTDDNKFTQIINNYNNKHGFRGLFIDDINKSSDQQIWIGAHTGVNKYSHEPKDISLLRIDQLYPSDLYNFGISFCEDDYSNLWIGFSNGHIVQYSLKDKNIKKFAYWQFDNISSIAKDERGNIWLGTEKSLVRYNPVKEKIIAKHKNKHYYIRGVISCENKIFQFTNHGGIYIFNDDNDIFKVDTIIDPGFNLLSPCFDNEKYIYFINLDHISRMNVHTYKTEELPYTIPDNLIQLIYRDNNIWVATQNGIYRIDVRTDSVHHFYDESNVSYNNVRSIIFDENDNLWYSTPYTLSVLNTRESFFIHYNAWDVFNNNDFYKRSVYRLNSGKLLFGGHNGVSIIDPASFNFDTSKYRLVITNFRLAGESVLPEGTGILKKSILFTDKITLNSKQSVFSFQLALLNYKNPDENEYAYRLDGLHDEWKYNGNEHIIRFYNIPSGHYTLRTRAKVSNGAWQEGQSVQIIIKPPFWQSVWFIIISIILFLLVMYYVLNYLIKLRKRNQLLEKEIIKKRAEKE